MRARDLFPRAESRTKLQIEADDLGWRVFVLVQVLDRFANEYRDEDVSDMSRIIDGMRHRIRRHMQVIDREKTI